MTDKNEVFNVEVHSTRPDGYRRGGFRLSRGTNRLEMVSESALWLLRRDTSLLVKNVVPASGSLSTRETLDETREENDLHRAEVTVSLQPASGEAAGAQRLADGVDPLVTMIAGLTPEQFTRGGVPDTKALSALANRPVTAAERDAAWELYQKTQAAPESTGQAQE